MTYDYDRRTATTAVPTDYAQATALRDELTAEYDRTSRALQALSGGGDMGLTPAAVQATSEWKAAKREYAAAFAALRNFNAIYVKRFKKEMREDRRRR